MYSSGVLTLQINSCVQLMLYNHLKATIQGTWHCYGVSDEADMFDVIRLTPSGGL